MTARVPPESGRDRVMPGMVDADATGEGDGLAAGPPARWAVGLGHVPLVACWGLLFLVLNHLPVRGPGLWGHVVYGEWILDHRSLPAADPALPLATGMQVLDTAWLSQVILALVEGVSGAESLSGLFALTVLASYLVLARVCYLEAGSKLLSTAGALIALAIAWSPATRFGPESFGALCFAGLLWLITSGGDVGAAVDSAAADRQPGAWPRNLRLYLGVPLLFVLWANLHESFVYGLAVLGCCLLGRMIDAGWQTRSVRRMLADRAMRRWLYLSELAAAATLLNPYGIDLLLETMGLVDGASPLSLQQGLVIRGVTGLTFVLSGVVLAIVLRHSRCRVPVEHFLLLAVFGAGAASGVRMFIWYGPVFALVLVPHLAELKARLWPARTSVPRAGARSRRYLMICATLAWAAAVLSPMGMALSGKSRTSDQLLASQMPLALAGHLAANPPRGLVFTPASWSHWLVLQAGAPRLQPFTTTDRRAIPWQVRQDYQRILAVGVEWTRILGRYRIDTVILSRAFHGQLMAALRYEEGWSVAYQDNLAIMFARDAAGSDGSPAPESEP